MREPCWQYKLLLVAKDYGVKLTKRLFHNRITQPIEDNLLRPAYLVSLVLWLRGQEVWNEVRMRNACRKR